MLIEHIQDPIPRDMSFANDIVLTGESREEINVKLELQRQAFETYDFRISRNKTKYIWNVSSVKDVQILT